jgi:hypothetical protein
MILAFLERKLNCECGGTTMVIDTRTVDGVPRRKRKCNVCSDVFFTKEEFLYKAADNPNRPQPKAEKPKVVFSDSVVKAVNRKKVETRRKVEDLKQERRMRVPSYFIEEDY